jgi:hypothetical protein
MVRGRMLHKIGADFGEQLPRQIGTAVLIA